MRHCRPCCFSRTIPRQMLCCRWFDKQQSLSNSRTAGADPQEVCPMLQLPYHCNLRTAILVEVRSLDRYCLQGSSYHQLSSEAAADLEASHRHLSNCADLQPTTEDCLAIRLLYVTGWQEPVIHYSAQGADWQTACLTRVSRNFHWSQQLLLKLPRAVRFSP